MRMVINPHLSKRFDEKVAEFAQEQVSALHWNCPTGQYILVGLNMVLLMTVML
jgi:hypothetical protein